MMRNHCLAKSIADVSLSELVRQIEYKANWYGRTVIKVDRWFPSSKTCNCCGHVVEQLDLAVRRWVCPRCAAFNDRDVNAAKNIRDEALRIIMAGRTPATATGGDVSRDGESNLAICADACEGRSP